MLVNNVEKELDAGRDTTPILINGRTFVPLRSIIEELGGTVLWDASANKVTVNLGQNFVELQIGSKLVKVNSEYKKSDVAPMLINGRTMLPLRFVAKILVVM